MGQGPFPTRHPPGPGGGAPAVSAGPWPPGPLRFRFLRVGRLSAPVFWAGRTPCGPSGA